MHVNNGKWSQAYSLRKTLVNPHWLPASYSPSGSWPQPDLEMVCCPRLPLAKIFKQIMDHQGGARKWCNTTDLACKQWSVMISFWLLRALAANLDNDAWPCFYLMVQACHSFQCLSHGADPGYVCLHALTQKWFKHFIKHHFWISKEYNFSLKTTLGIFQHKVEWTLPFNWQLLWLS